MYAATPKTIRKTLRALDRTLTKNEPLLGEVERQALIRAVAKTLAPENSQGVSIEEAARLAAERRQRQNVA